MRAPDSRAMLLPAAILLSIGALLPLAAGLRERFAGRSAPTPAQVEEAVRHAINDAQRLSIRGQARAAEERLRRVAFSGLANAELYLALAQTLLADESGDFHERATEALMWAERACDLTGHQDPTALATLAAAQRATGDVRSATLTLSKAHELARHKNRRMSRPEDVAP